VLFTHIREHIFYKMFGDTFSGVSLDIYCEYYIMYINLKSE